MNKNKSPTKYQEGLISAISAGFFLLLIGVIFVTTPNLFDSILDFFGDFEIVSVPNTNMMLPAPENPSLHQTVYQAAGIFTIALALFQAFMLALRFFIPSTWEKRAETVGNFVYWIASAFLIQIFLIETTEWFIYWSALIAFIGISLIIRAAVVAISRL